jgi:hypothetical protein
MSSNARAPRLNIGPFASRAEALAWLAEEGHIGDWHLIFAHDEGAACTPTHCVCTPDFYLEPATPESSEQAARETAEWAARPEARRGRP